MTLIGGLQLLLILSCGFLLWTLGRKNALAIPFGKYLLISLFTSVACATITGFILALINAFSVWGIIAVEYASAALLVFIRICSHQNRQKKGKESNSLIRGIFILPQKPVIKIPYIFISLFVIALAFLYFKPAEYLLGGFDPGIYVNSGVNLARTGSPFFEEKIVKDLGYKKSRRFLGMFTINPLGTSIVSQFEGKVASQFYPGLPIWYAIAFKTLGYDYFLYIQPLISLLCLFSLYLLASAVFNKTVALISVALYSVNIITVWFSRYPVAEPLTILLISSALYCLFEYQAGGSKMFSITGGLLFASALITRPDAALALISLGVIGLYRFIWRKWKKSEGWFYIISFTGLIASIFYALSNTGGYLHGVVMSFIGIGVKKEQSYIKVAVLAAVLLTAVVSLIILLRKRDRVSSFLNRYKRLGRFLPTVFACLLLSLVIFQFFIRPALPFAFLSPHANSLTRLGWYFAPLGIGWQNIIGAAEPWKFILLKFGVLLAALASVYAVEKSRDERKTLFHLIWIGYALLYFQNIRIEPMHIWLNRRYLMFILFGLVTCLSSVLVQLWRKKNICKSFKKPVFFTSVMPDLIRHLIDKKHFIRLQNPSDFRLFGRNDRILVFQRSIYLKLNKAAVLLLSGFYFVNFLAGTSLIAPHTEWKAISRNLKAFNESLPKNCAVIIDGSPPHTLEPLHLPLKTALDRKVSTLKNNSVHIDSLPIVCEELAHLYGKVLYITPIRDSIKTLPGRWNYEGYTEIKTEILETAYVLEYRPPEKFLNYSLPIHIFSYLSKNETIGMKLAIGKGGNDNQNKLEMIFSGFVVIYF